MKELYQGRTIIRQVDVAAGREQEVFVVKNETDGTVLGNFPSVDAAKVAIDQAKDAASPPDAGYIPDPRIDGRGNNQTEQSNGTSRDVTDSP